MSGKNVEMIDPDPMNGIATGISGAIERLQSAA